MRRTVSEARVGTAQVRYKVRIEDDPSERGWMAQVRLVRFMEALTQSPDLLNCGFAKPDRLVFSHNGNAWVAEGEALVDDSAEAQ